MTDFVPPSKDGALNFAKDINDSFIANINHALRTPLNGVVGMSDLLAKSGLDENQLRYASIIRESTENLMLQLDNILELAKIDDGELIVKAESYRLRDLIKEAVRPLIPAAVKRGIPISVECGLNVPDVVSVDGAKLRLILTNLLSCALRLADRGKITLKITGAPDEEDENLFNLRVEIGNSKILYDMLHGAIEQYGQHNMADLRQFGEVTVSLITVQKLLWAMNSGILLDNLEGSEPPFHFNIRVNASSDQVEPSAYTVIEGKRALVLQRDLLELNILTQCLQLWGVDYRTIDDEERLLDALHEAHMEEGDYQVLFCENLMPGIQLAKIKEKVPHIVMTTDRHALNDALLNEFSARLHSPAYPEELLSTLVSFYQEEGQQQEEVSLSEQASQHVHQSEYPPVNAKVMVVEDDFVSRIYAAELLEGFGCVVATAENGVQALTRFLNHAEYDVIFMDCMMPQMDGYNATRKIREAGYDVPVIALTANTLEQDKEKCLSVGMSDYVQKPVKEQDLYAVLTKHLKK